MSEKWFGHENGINHWQFILVLFQKCLDFIDLAFFYDMESVQVKSKVGSCNNMSAYMFSVLPCES